jgi:hypothetical protein
MVTAIAGQPETAKYAAAQIQVRNYNASRLFGLTQ